MYLQSIKSVKHNAAKSINRSILKKSRHIGFSVLIVHSPMAGIVPRRKLIQSDTKNDRKIIWTSSLGYSLYTKYCMNLPEFIYLMVCCIVIKWPHHGGTIGHQVKSRLITICYEFVTLGENMKFEIIIFCHIVYYYSFT